MADEAEARGDSEGALDLMETFALGPDGKPFWRPARWQRLVEVATYGAALPDWVISRWICAQAAQCLDGRTRDQHLRAAEVAIELLGGRDRLPGRDPMDAEARIVDHDWIYRQLFLYELGGLDTFLRHHASSALLARVDSVEDWARAPMGGYRHLGSTSESVGWLDLGSGETVATPNIGTAVLLTPGDCVIGRLVPSRHGPVFEAPPLETPEPVAQQVAEQPTDWLDVLRGELSSEDSPVTTHRPQPSLVSDVPEAVWVMVLMGWDTEGPGGRVDAAFLARRLLDVGARELAGDDDEGREEEVDVWPCLAAAVLEPSITQALALAAGPEDLRTLTRLSEALAEPAASVCRGLADDLSEAA